MLTKAQAEEQVHLENNQCPYCGAKGVDGYPGCQALMHELTARAFSDPSYSGMHRAFVDCYCLQHPEFYCVSAKSYAAHLAGLCCQIEYAGRHEIHAAVQRWLNGKVELQKPFVPEFRGAVTVTYLHEADELVEYRRRLDEWAGSIWNAYLELQDTARSYIQAAMAKR